MTGHRLNLLMPPELVAAGQAAAHAHGFGSLAGLLRWLLLDYLKREERKEK